MWETIFNLGMIAVGVTILAFIAWAIDKEEKKEQPDYFNLTDDDF